MRAASLSRRGDAEERREQAAAREAEERDEVVLVVHREVQVRPRQEEVEAERGHERRREGGQSTAELADDDRQREEREREVRGDGQRRAAA